MGSTPNRCRAHTQRGSARSIRRSMQPTCLLEHLTNRQFGENTHRQYHPNDNFVRQLASPRIDTIGVFQDLPNVCRSDNLFQGNQPIQNPARFVGRKHATSLLLHCHSLLARGRTSNPNFSGGCDLRLFQRSWVETHGYRRNVATRRNELSGANRQCRKSPHPALSRRERGPTFMTRKPKLPGLDLATEHAGEPPGPRPC